jgi:hypothetical protein
MVLPGAAQTTLATQPIVKVFTLPGLLGGAPAILAVPITNSTATPVPTHSLETRSAGLETKLISFFQNVTWPNPLYTLLILSIPLLLYPAYASQRARNRTARTSHDAQARLLERWKNAWATVSDWNVFFAMTDMWTAGALPWGPWNLSTIRGARWPEKEDLYDIVRYGMIPLAIQKGGMQRYVKSTNPNFSEEEDDKQTWPSIATYLSHLPVHVQSKGRAYFDFVIPTFGIKIKGAGEKNPGEKALQRFLNQLLNGKKYAVTICQWDHSQVSKGTRVEPASFAYHKSENLDVTPLESGAESRFPFLLPFKRDRVLTPGRNLDEEDDEMRNLKWKRFVEDEDIQRYTPKMYRPGNYTYVRIEAQDYAPHRLDRYVNGLAKRCGVLAVSPEREIVDFAEQLKEQFGLDLPKHRY